MINKELLRTGISRIIVTGGIASAGRKLFPKKGALILVGHRVSDDDEGCLQGLRPDWFDEQLEYLSRNYRFLSLNQLLDYFEQGQSIPSNSVVITFDDGFRDNYTNAYPILRRYQASATVFLVTGCVTSGELPWPQKVGYVLQNTDADSLCHETTGGRELSLRSQQDRTKANGIVWASLCKLPRTQREREIENLCEMLKVQAPRDRMLTWEQVETMHKGGMEFGAHTVSHPWMAQQSPEEARWEMETSLKELQDRLGIERPPFVFPGGSYTPELVDMASSVGFRCVFQSRGGIRVNSPDVTNQFSLSRVGLPNSPAFILEAELDGPLHSIRRIYRS